MRSRILTGQWFSVAEYVIAALCLEGKLQLPLLVDPLTSIRGVEGSVTPTYDSACPDFIQVVQCQAIVSEFGVRFRPVQVDFTQPADNR